MVHALFGLMQDPLASQALATLTFKKYLLVIDLCGFR